MGLRTGRPRGRPPGARNKRSKETVALANKAAKALKKALPDGSFEGNAHAFLMAVYKDETNELKDRLAAATAAIGYEKPKYSAVTLKGDPDKPLVHEHINADADAFTSRIVSLASRNGKGSGASKARQ